ncbi:hypothetical protein SLOPH_816 [Spraguea lophii 42_110]|uniref:Uncharacterized protein n=1 Tax=Spraguea lophii (strain 42_110) TaxID=1358809 RepID=S7XJW9_SPRLO|nr:hypothetical protein SLOPH_816 [Spraguea lophii 42_110]
MVNALYFLFFSVCESNHKKDKTCKESLKNNIKSDNDIGFLKDIRIIKNMSLNFDKKNNTLLAKTGSPLSDISSLQFYSYNITTNEIKLEDIKFDLNKKSIEDGSDNQEKDEENEILVEVDDSIFKDNEKTFLLLEKDKDGSQMRSNFFRFNVQDEKFEIDNNIEKKQANCKLKFYIMWFFIGICAGVVITILIEKALG